MGRGYHAYIFTYNNFTSEGVARWIAWMKACCSFYVFAYEKAPSGTPHLQGCCWFEKPKQNTNLIAKGSLVDELHIYIRPQRGNMASQRKYIVEGLKDDERKEWIEKTEPEQYGEWPTEAMWEAQSPKQGKRTDLDNLVEDVQAGMSKRQCLIKHKTVCARYGKYVNELIHVTRQEDAYKRIQEEMATVELRDWQQQLFDLLKEPPHPRKIYWVYDPVGNKGKSFFAKWLRSQFPLGDVETYSGGKSADIAYQIDLPKIIVFDICRDPDFMPNQLIEDVKNGIFMSPKYESVMKEIPVPHVLVLSNSTPKHGTFSADRIELIAI
jgi:hypothetical protein